MLGPEFPFGRIEGNFSVLLTASSESVSISQMAFIDASSQSLRFKAIPGNGTFGVTIAGAPIQIVPLETTPAYTLYGGDVSPFAGQTMELKFTAFSSSGLNNLYLDSIEFSPVVVPEPRLMTFAVVASVLLSVELWRRKSQK